MHSGSFIELVHPHSQHSLLLFVAFYETVYLFLILFTNAIKRTSPEMSPKTKPIPDMVLSPKPVLSEDVNL